MSGQTDLCSGPYPNRKDYSNLLDESTDSNKSNNSKELADSKKSTSPDGPADSISSSVSQEPIQPNVSISDPTTSKPEAYSKLNADPEKNVRSFNFDDKTIRRAFIRKVYLILMLQLFVTFGIASFFTFNRQAKLFAWRNANLVYVFMIATFVLSIAMACCSEVRRRAPMNFIILGVFTLLMSFFVGFVASANDEHHVLIALGITITIFVGLTLFTFQTKFDFTRWMPYLFIALMVLIIFALLLIFLPDETGILIFSGLVALLFSFFVIYDTQLILGGKHKYSLSPEEYIFAALNLYLDIINIFLSFIDIFGVSSWK